MCYFQQKSALSVPLGALGTGETSLRQTAPLSGSTCVFMPTGNLELAPHFKSVSISYLNL